MNHHEVEQNQDNQGGVTSLVILLSERKLLQIILIFLRNISKK